MRSKSCKHRRSTRDNPHTASMDTLQTHPSAPAASHPTILHCRHSCTNPVHYNSLCKIAPPCHPNINPFTHRWEQGEVVEAAAPPTAKAASAEGGHKRTRSRGEAVGRTPPGAGSEGVRNCKPQCRERAPLLPAQPWAAAAELEGSAAWGVSRPAEQAAEWGARARVGYLLGVGKTATVGASLPPARGFSAHTRDPQAGEQCGHCQRHPLLQKKAREKLKPVVWPARPAL